MSGSSNMQQKMLNSRTLRDFLSENNSNEFKSFSRKPIPSTTMKSNPRILNSLLNAVVRSISSFTVTTSSKSPSILPRSLSRKLAKRRIRNRGGEINVVRIKDIVRWRSFRDLAEEEEPSQPLDFSTTTTTTSCSSSNGSSWSDSDFTCGYLSSCDGNNFVEAVQNDVVGMGKSKRFSLLVGKDLVDATTGTTVGTPEDFTCQEEEIQSPVSVLQIGEDEFSPFDQNLATIERRKQKCIESFTTLDKCWSVDKNISFEDEYDDDENEDSEEQDRIERRARELLHYVKATAKCSKAKLDHQLLLDFFRDGLKTRRNYQSRINYDDHDEDAFEREIMKIAEDWIDGSFEHDLVHGNKDGCIREMERRQTWSKFEEEQEELAWEIENDILENLIVDIF